MEARRDDKWEVATIEGRVEVAPPLSILYADAEPTPVLVRGSALFNFLMDGLAGHIRLGSYKWPTFTGRAKLTGHYCVTFWNPFPAMLFDLTAGVFIDDDTKKEVVINRPLVDKIEMDLFYSEGGTQVVRLPGEASPAVTIDLQTFFTLHQQINLLPVPAEYDRGALPPPAIRLQRRINRLWDQFRYGLEKHGLWGDPLQDQQDQS